MAELHYVQSPFSALQTKSSLLFGVSKEISIKRLSTFQLSVATGFDISALARSLQVA